MATARLALGDKNDIRRVFEKTLKRSLNNKPFLIDKEDLFEFGISCLPEAVGEKYAWLYEHDRKLTITHSWRPKIELSVPHPTEPDVTRTYQLHVEGTLPKDPSFCPAQHPLFNDLLAWAEWYSAQEANVKLASNYIKVLVDSCTTVGQISRLLPPDVIQSIPTWLKNTLSEAVRQSRVPAAWTNSINVNTPERQEQFMQTLVLGAISLDAPEYCNYASFIDHRNK